MRVGLIDGAFVLNPTYPERTKSRLDLIVAGTADAIVMVEAGAKEATEEEIITALETAHAAIRQIVAAIDDLAREVGKQKKVVKPREIGHDFYREVEEKVYLPLAEAMRVQREARQLSARRPGPRRARREHSRRGSRAPKSAAKHIFKDLKEKVMRDEILERGQRLDGRRFDEIRPITIDIGVLPARARLGGLHPRRDAGARQRDARHRRRRAEDRAGRRRDVQAVHAALQLPAVLGG